MADGKYRYDSGRARTARFRDRARSSFDDDMINLFLDELGDEWCDQRSRVPVRFGSRRLVDHLSDSTLAAAILRSGDLDETDHSPPLTLDCDFPETLFDLGGPVADARARDEVAPPSQPDAVHAAVTGTGRSFRAWGVVQGFLIGAVATAALLMLAGLLT